jgi:hypothetical protein
MRILSPSFLLILLEAFLYYVFIYAYVSFRFSDESFVYVSLCFLNINVFVEEYKF